MLLVRVHKLTVGEGVGVWSFGLQKSEGPWSSSEG